MAREYSVIHLVADGDVVATSRAVACKLQMRHTSAVVMHGLIV